MQRRSWAFCLAPTIMVRLVLRLACLVLGIDASSLTDRVGISTASRSRVEPNRRHPQAVCITSSVRVNRRFRDVFVPVLPLTFGAPDKREIVTLLLGNGATRHEWTPSEALLKSTRIAWACYVTQPVIRLLQNVVHSLWPCAGSLRREAHPWHHRPRLVPRSSTPPIESPAVPPGPRRVPPRGRADGGRGRPCQVSAGAGVTLGYYGFPLGNPQYREPRFARGICPGVRAPFNGGSDPGWRGSSWPVSEGGAAPLAT